MIVTLKLEDNKSLHLHCNKIEVNQVNSNILLHLSKDQNNSEKVAEAGLLLGQGDQLIISCKDLIEIR